MKLSGILLICLAAAAFASDRIGHPFAPLSMEDQQEGSALVQGNNAFAIDLFGEVCSSGENSNVFFSPLSISAALGMTYAGAEGETATEMAEVLHFSRSPEITSNQFRHLTWSLEEGNTQDTGTDSGEPLTLAISNGLWVQNGFPLLDSFVSELVSCYNAQVENLDFAGDSEGSRETINSWVAQSTMEKILDLIPSGILSADTRVVLTNAVYFKASWQHPFNASVTSDGRFLLENGTSVTVPMMSQERLFSYAGEEQWSAVSMDYAGNTARMIIILPEIEMDEFEETFTAELLQEITGSLRSQNILLTMPGFEFTESISLSDILRNMGMELAFSVSADFSGITGSRDLFISEVLHKAFVKVDEEGTEAAAATAVVMNLLSIPEPPVEMNINKPFIFLIMDNSTDAILFMGRVMDPSV